MKINPIGHLVKTNPIQTQSKPKKANTNPNKANFKGKKMPLHLTINGRHKSFGYYADEIEAAELEQYKKEKVKIDKE